MTDLSISEGVYYHRNDYAGFWLRLLVDAIDATIVCLICAALTYVIISNSEPSELMVQVILAAWSIIAFSYFVLLKRSKFRTIGYRMGKIQVVNLKGERPSLFSLTYRMLISFFGPLNFIFDLIWLSGDENKQAMRDKFAKTYVVKTNAVPAGSGRQVYAIYDFLGWRVTFREVKRPQAASK